MFGLLEIYMKLFQVYLLFIENYPSMWLYPYYPVNQIRCVHKADRNQSLLQ